MLTIGKEIAQKDGSGRKRLYIYVECADCGCVFAKPKRFVMKYGGILSSRHFCNRACYRKFKTYRITVRCAYCGIQIEKVESKLRSDLHFCCKSHKDKAQTIDVGIIKCRYYKNGKGSYRAIAFRNYEKKCEWCCDDFVELLEVHHIDKNRSNNEIVNLMVLCVRCHAMVTRGLVKIVKRKPVIMNNISDTAKKLLKKWKKNIGVNLPRRRRI